MITAEQPVLRVANTLLDFAKANRRRFSGSGPETTESQIAREFALAATHLEDAIHRFTRAFDIENSGEK